MPKDAEKEKGPRPVEIAIAAVLSVIVGFVGAAAFLMFQTPERVSELPDPDDRELGRLYFVEGKSGNASHDTWQPKEAAVKTGRSGRLSLVEEELNRWAAQSLQPDQEAEQGFISVEPGQPEFRIADSLLTIRSPLTWSAFGVSQTFDAQTSGELVQRDGTYVLDHGRVYVGSCPLPGMLGRRLVRDVTATFDLSAELREGWASLESVELDEDALRLVIP